MKAISRTAYYTAGIRMQDAQAERPIVGDSYASLFLDDEGLRVLERFAGLDRPRISNLYRHRIIDELVERELASGPGATVVLIGAGFDSRAYRLTGGAWLEVDEPELIRYKDERLPAARCPSPLTRIAVDFGNEPLAEKLAPFATDGRVLVVIEGVFMYLEERQIRATLAALAASFPGHLLICDLMSRQFFEKYGGPVHNVLLEMNAPFRYSVEAAVPEAIFLEHGYRLKEKLSIVGRVIREGRGGPPKLLFDLFLKTLRTGYSVCVFEPAGGG